MVTRNNISGLRGEETFQGVDCVLLIVDYVNAMSAETQDSQDPDATAAGLKFVQDLVGTYVNLLGVSELHDANTQQSFVVRRDSVTQTTLSELQTAIRALQNSVGASGEGKISANMSAVTLRFGALAQNPGDPVNLKIAVV